MGWEEVEGKKGVVLPVPGDLGLFVIQVCISFSGHPQSSLNYIFWGAMIPFSVDAEDKSVLDSHSTTDLG